MRLAGRRFRRYASWHYIGQGGLKKWKSYEQNAASISYTFKLTYKTEENAINI